MTCYNKINGTFGAGNYDTVTDVLRGEWGFDGLVTTDWFSGETIANELHAGNDMNQPGYNEAAAYGKKVNSESQKVLKPKEVGGMYYYLHRRLGVDKEYIQMFFHRLCSASYNEKSFYKKTMKNLGDKEYIRRSGVTRTNELIECWNAMVHGCSTNRVHYSDWFEKPLARRSDTEFATAAL
jgi:hypothetical protein